MLVCVTTEYWVSSIEYQVVSIITHWSTVLSDVHYWWYDWQVEYLNYLWSRTSINYWMRNRTLTVYRTSVCVPGVVCRKWLWYWVILFGAHFYGLIYAHALLTYVYTYLEFCCDLTHYIMHFIFVHFCLFNYHLSAIIISCSTLKSWGKTHCPTVNDPMIRSDYSA